MINTYIIKRSNDPKDIDGDDLRYWYVVCPICGTPRQIMDFHSASHNLLHETHQIDLAGMTAYRGPIPEHLCYGKVWQEFKRKLNEKHGYV